MTSDISEQKALISRLISNISYKETIHKYIITTGCTNSIISGISLFDTVIGLDVYVDTVIATMVKFYNSDIMYTTRRINIEYIISRASVSKDAKMKELYTYISDTKNDINTRLTYGYTDKDTISSIYLQYIAHRLIGENK